ncbi:hypothetical protein G6F65_023141 [Rhizopus arrhizus]|nr:hypothetical protein G6F65_023141 [Rhizopus arrhizus]
MNESVKPFRKPTGNWAPYDPEHIDPEVPASVYETIGKIVTQWAKLDDYSVKPHGLPDSSGQAQENSSIQAGQRGRKSGYRSRENGVPSA